MTDEFSVAHADLEEGVFPLAMTAREGAVTTLALHMLQQSLEQCIEELAASNAEDTELLALKADVELVLEKIRG